MRHSVGRQHPHLICGRGCANETTAHTAHRRLGGGGEDSGTVARCGDSPPWTSRMSPGSIRTCDTPGGGRRGQLAPPSQGSGPTRHACHPRQTHSNRVQRELPTGFHQPPPGALASPDPPHHNPYDRTLPPQHGHHTQGVQTQLASSAHYTPSNSPAPKSTSAQGRILSYRHIISGSTKPKPTPPPPSRPGVQTSAIYGASSSSNWHTSTADS